MEIIKVGRASRATKVAGYIAALVREQKPIRVRAIGAAALNQAIKAVIIARSYLAVNGVDIVCIPVLDTIDVNGQPVLITALDVERRGEQPAVEAAP